MAKKKWISAEDLMKEIEGNPEGIAKRERLKARQAALVKVTSADEAGIISELQSIGIFTRTVSDFLNVDYVPPMALPILVMHLREPHHPTVREWIVRILGGSNAHQLVFEPLCAAYLKERDPSVLWAIAYSLSTMARFEEVAHLPRIEVFAKLFRR